MWVPGSHGVMRVLRGIVRLFGLAYFGLPFFAGCGAEWSQVLER
jgi:hypothetical protein